MTRTGDLTAALDVPVTLTQSKPYLDTAQRSLTVTIPAGEASADFDFTWPELQLPASEVLENGTLTATVTPPDNYVTGAAASAAVEIQVFLVVQIEQDYTVLESAGPLDVTLVARTGEGAARPTFDTWISLSTGLRVGVDTAGPGDFGAISLMVLFAAADFTQNGAVWELKVTRPVPIVDDTEIEDDETLQVKIETSPGLDDRVLFAETDGTGTGVSDRKALITIIDNDTPEVTITADAPSVTYLTGDATSFNPAFTVTRSVVTAAALEVQVTLADVPFLSGVELSQTVTIPANEASAKLTFRDSDFFRRPGVVVAGGTLTATVQPAADYEIGAANEATMDIVVFMTVRIEQSSYTVAEDAGPLAVTLIARTGVGAARPGTDVAVAFDTLAGTAMDTAGGDFVAVSAFDRRVTFAPDDFAQVGGVWQAEQTVEVEIADDPVAGPVDEDDEAFTVMLSALAGQGLVVPVDLDGRNPGTQAVPVTITDDDNPVVTIRANRPTVTFPGYFDPTFTLRRATDATAAPLAVTVELTRTGGPYANNAPLTRTVTIPAGATIGEFTVARGNPPADEPLATGVLTATVQAAADYDLGADGADGVASVNIVPFMTVRIEQPSYTVDEGAGTLAVTLIAQTGEGATWPPVQSADLVNFTPLTSFQVSTFTASDTAIYDQDFISLNEIVPFSVADFVPDGDAWRAEQTVTVMILDDAANDDGEMFNLRLERTSGLGSRVLLVNSDGTRSGSMRAAPITIADNDTAPAVTPPHDALVGNTGQPGTGDHRLVGGATDVGGSRPQHTQAQRFTTGGDTRGYTLTAIDVLVDDFRTGARPGVSIHNAVSGNPAGASLFDLDNPATPVDNAVNTFTMPDGGYLAPNTDYFVVFRDRRATGVLQAYELNDTASAADAGAAVGWSLAGESLSRVNNAAWVSAAGKLQIAVRGAVNGAQMVTVAAAEPRVNYVTGASGTVAASAATFTVTRTPIVTATGTGTDAALTATVTLTPTGGAYLDDVQQSQTQTVTIPMGELSAELIIAGDDLRLPAAAPVVNGTLTATVQSGSGYEVGADDEASVEIVPLMTVRIGQPSYAVVEGTGIALPRQEVTLIARTGDGAAQPTADVTVRVSTQDGTATARTATSDGDYIEFNQSVTLAASDFRRDGTAWQLEKSVASVQILEDAEYEGDETFEIVLAAPAAGLADGILLVNADRAMPGEQRVTVTIDDNADASADATLGALALTLADASGDRVALNPTFNPNRRNYRAHVEPAVTSITIAPTLGDDSASFAYAGGSGAVLTDADTTATGFQVALDNVETVITVVVTAQDGSTGTYTVTVTRAVPVVTIAAAPTVFYTEDVTWTVTRAGAMTAVEVPVTLTQDKPYLDAAQRSRTVTIPAGEPSAVLTVARADLQLPDDAVVAAGTLTATVQPGTGYEVGAANVAAVEIVPFMTVRPDRLSYEVAEGAGTLAVTITARTGDGVARPAAGTGVAVVVATQDGTATGGEDFTAVDEDDRVIFAAAEFTAAGNAWQLEKTIDVEILDNDEYEGNETFTISLSDYTSPDNRILFVNAAGAMPGDQSVTVTIDDSADATTDATLSALGVDDGRDDLPLTPTFASNVFSYAAADVDNAVTAVTLRATVNDTGATVAYADGDGTALTDAVENETGHQVELDVGANVIDVVVTAQDGSTATYTVTVTRALPVVTIAAAAPTVFYQGDATDDVTWTVTRRGVTTEELAVTVKLDQDKEYLIPAQRSRTVTIPVGDSSAVLTVAGADLQLPNAVAVATGTLTATVLADAGYAVGAEAAAVVNLPVFMTVRFGQPTYTVVEDAGTLLVTLVARTGAGVARPEDDVEVSVGSLNGTTTTGDFTAFLDTVTFAAADFRRNGAIWELAGTVEVTILDDMVIEGDETFTIAHRPIPDDRILFVNADGTMTGDQRVTVTITDNDVSVISIESASDGDISEGEAALFRLIRTGDTTDALSVPVTVSEDGAMVAAANEGAATATFAAGSATATLSVPTEDDALDERNSDVTVALVADTANPANYVLDTPASADVTVRDNDASEISIASGGPVDEGEAAVFTLTRVGDTTDILGVPVTVSETGDMVAAADEGTQTVMFAAGADTATLSVPTLDDALDEPNSDVTVALMADTADPPAYAPGTPVSASADVRVNDNDAPEITIASDGPVDEGEAAVFTLTRVGDTTIELTVDVSVSVSETGDMVAASDKGVGAQTVTFAAESATATLSVPTLDDSLDEPNSDVTVALMADTADPPAYALGTPVSASADVRVNDNDAPAISIAIAPDGPPVTEGETVVFTLTRIGVTTAALGVPVTVSETGAMVVAGDAGTQTVMFDAGAATATLSVATLDDTIAEPNSEVTAALVADTADPPAYVPGTPASIDVTVNDDDVPRITIASGDDVDEGGAAVFTLTRTGDTADAPSVTVTVSEDGAMVAANDKGTQTVTFAVGSAMATLSVPTLDDQLDEADSKVTVALMADTADPPAYALGTPVSASADVTVNDNDAPEISIIASDGPVDEGEAAVFTLTRVGDTTIGLTVDVSVSETGDMVAAGDKGEGAQTATFVVGSAMATLSVATVDDTTAEADSVVTAALVADTTNDPATYVPGTPASADVTVRDDDTSEISITSDGPVSEGEAAVFHADPDEECVGSVDGWY